MVRRSWFNLFGTLFALEFEARYVIIDAHGKLVDARIGPHARLQEAKKKYKSQQESERVHML